MSLPQGKMLGGSSAINAQMLAAPSAALSDGWAKLGNPGWDWHSIANYYRKPFKMHAPDKETMESLALDWIDPEVNGSGGPIQATFVANKESPVPKAWAATFAALNLATTADPFSGRSIGAFNNLATIDPRSGTRSFAAPGYAAPAMQRPNFRLITEAMVNKIVFENQGTSVRASAIEVIVDGRTQTFSATTLIPLAASIICYERTPVKQGDMGSSARVTST